MTTPPFLNPLFPLTVSLGGGGILLISSDGDVRMGAKIKTPQNQPPQKTRAEFSSLKNFQKALKFSCTLFAELCRWDHARALPRIFRLF